MTFEEFIIITCHEEMRAINIIPSTEPQKPRDYRPTRQKMMRNLELSSHGSAAYHHPERDDRPRRFFSMLCGKQDWDAETGLIETNWNSRMMQRGENWAYPAKPWQERIER